MVVLESPPGPWWRKQDSWPAIGEWSNPRRQVSQRRATQRTARNCEYDSFITHGFVWIYMDLYGFVVLNLETFLPAHCTWIDNLRLIAQFWLAPKTLTPDYMCSWLRLLNFQVPQVDRSFGWQLAGPQKDSIPQALSAESLVPSWYLQALHLVEVCHWTCADYVISIRRW